MNIEKQNTPLEKTKTIKKEFFELLRFIVIAAIIVIPFRMFIAQPFVVNGASMSPTFTTGQYLIVEHLTYRRSEPQRGDVIIFKYPLRPSDFYIKRIIALPGETITIQGSEVFIKKSGSSENLKLEEPYLLFTSNNNISKTLADDEYFVMGDNRPNSSDSRTWGPLSQEHIVGKAFLRLLPLRTFEMKPGHHPDEFSQN
jgi:signal peptidase I